MIHAELRALAAACGVGCLLFAASAQDFAGTHAGLALGGGSPGAADGVADAGAPRETRFFEVGPVDVAGAGAVPGRLLVRFAPGTDEAGAHAAAGAQAVLESYTLVPGLQLVQVKPGAEAEAAAAYAAWPGVLYAERDALYRTTAQAVPWGVTAVRGPAGALASRPAASSVRVAVLDTGLATAHPDLPAPAAAASFIAGQAVADGNGHGTHCAGTVLALDNDIGVVGVAPDATLLVGKVLSNAGSGSTSGIIAGIQWAVQNGAKVISMSLGGGDSSAAFRDACDAAAASPGGGVLVVAASGNSGSAAPSFPAGFPSVLSVGAIDGDLARAGFSNFGSTLDIVAPGVNVISTVPSSSSTSAIAEWAGLAQDAAPLAGSGAGSVSGKIIFSGLGGAPSDFPATVAGQIAFVRRGTFTFQAKVANAVAAGARAVIVANNVDGLFSGTLNTTVGVPVVGVSRAAGDLLLGLGSPLGSVAVFSGPYASFDGTSMACPHVAGVAALVWGQVGVERATAAQVRAALESSARDLGDPGHDDLYGAGLVDAAAALRALEAIVGPAPSGCGVADVVSIGGFPPGDGALSVDDYTSFVNAFSADESLADIVSIGGNPPADGIITVDDYTSFINAFVAGCE